MPEQHLFIIWKNALEKREEIIEDIKKHFNILRMYNMRWSDKLYSENLSRFYGTNLPKGCHKEEHCGRGEFLVIIVEDNNPIYGERETSKGVKHINTNLFDRKTYYREITGGGHKVHATNTLKETNHDLTLLFNKSVEDFLKENETPWDGEIINMEKDLFGSDGWNDVRNMFYALNNCIDYVIIRNYETLPEEIYINKHNDIDVICSSFEDCAYILNAKKVFQEEHRIHYKTKVDDNEAFFDLRYLGDDYYCREWEEEILRNRVYNKKGFYTIDNDNYFYALLYHALIHKFSFAEDYKERLIKMNPKYTRKCSESDLKSLIFLYKWIDKKKYIFTRPIDKSVHFNEELLNQYNKLALVRLRRILK